MSRFYSLLVVATATLLLCGNVVGATPQEKYGRGRLLRKWRDDLMGKDTAQNKEKSAQNDSENQPTPARKPQPSNAPTPAQRPTQPSPQPTAKSSQRLSPNQAAAQSWAKPPRKTAVPVQSVGYQNLVSKKPTPTAEPPQSAISNRFADQPSSKKPVAEQPIGKQPEGFGMVVQADKEENLVVLQVDPNGNAAKAGIQRGDYIVQAGGADVGSLDEFNEVAKLLGEGDQIEFQFSRQGQKETVTIQYGATKEFADGETLIDSESDQSRTPVTGQYDFVPQETENGFHSVLDQPISNNLAPAQNQLRQNSAAQTVDQQQQTIERMKKEIESLRRQQNNDNVQTSNSVSTRNSPSLTGPGN